LPSFQSLGDNFARGAVGHWVGMLWGKEASSKGGRFGGGGGKVARLGKCEMSGFSRRIGQGGQMAGVKVWLAAGQGGQMGAGAEEGEGEANNRKS
jgi:hypothetical protein